MKKLKFIVILLALTNFYQVLYGQFFSPSVFRNSFLMAPASVYQEGLVGFVNPANLHFISRMETRLYWNTAGSSNGSVNDAGFFTGIKGLGFGLIRQNFGGRKFTDYRISTGFGSDDFALGIGYGWSSHGIWEKRITPGAIIRPGKYLSLGLIGNFSVESNARAGLAEIGFRPFGTPAITLFTDAFLQKETRVSDMLWSAGLIAEVLPGVHLIGRYFNDSSIQVGFSLNLGRFGASAQVHYGSNKKRQYNTYMIRAGDWRRTPFLEMIKKGNRFLPMSLKGRVKYLRYALFDKSTLRFMDVLENIRRATKDPRVNTIALNLSGLLIRPEHAWEIREELKMAQKAGKQVVAFIDNAGMTGYHLASVADKIVMDPEGSLLLPGFTLGNTYFKGTLQKLGLGFDEWRFFKYKSAAEVLSRDKMSDPDRQQRQAFVDDWYELVRSDVCQSRGMRPEEFDHLVDDEVFFLPEKALEMGLVDTLARWSAKEDVLTHFAGRKLQSISSKNLLNDLILSDQWGQKPQIAVVYGLGECALDRGIRARWLEKVFLKLAKNSAIKAVVFRVDSPGGDGMASDMVAEALKKCKEKKPVIISQGQVAGSGGYWISMYGNQIVAGPNTITGSIGVIGGWIYDKGFSKKLGMTSDVVTRGKHADLGFGITLPIIGARIPARNLNREERQQVEYLIKKMYDKFVGKVARGRNISETKVREIAEGRFYSGIDGKNIGLVDKIGGLFTAIAVAKQQAGLGLDELIEIVEIPKNRSLLDLFPSFAPLKASKIDQQSLNYIQMFIENPGKPLPMMLPGTYPEFEK